MGQVLNIFFINISIIYLLISLTFYVMRDVLPIQASSPVSIRIWFGLSTGVIAVFLTTNSIMVDGARIDLRIIPFALAAVFAGPVGVTVAIIVSVAARLMTEGFSSIIMNALVMISIFWTIAIGLSHQYIRRGQLYAGYIAIGMMLVLVRVVGQVSLDTFINVFIPYFMMTSIGAWMCYWGAKKLETHLWMFRLHTHRATVDELTGLPNRYRTLERLSEVELSGRPWTLFVIDVDHFKQLNDTYGHRAGDAALHHIGKTLQAHCPAGGFVGRYGGEEFLMVLEDAGDVRLMADEIVTVIRDTPFSFEGTHIPMTVSLGATLAGAEPGTVVFERADAALYAAKTSGRDQAKIG
ncbi:diguanylate cyclase [Exiguobacterium sp. AM39-5BH]|uniref:diguanylate cyclase n=1 Tax=Exiguobacterium sp. AM39-5BH TaxID=2292355 RepID=UPI000FE1E358|nr:diguanylate cyclase [Exiguobacterium sp. AM39-5BH]RHB49758.1 diguanylate cyclase [Exiguobacterium sp. AM39-5BH]